MLAHLLMVHHSVLIHFIKDSPSEKTLLCGILRRLALAEQRHQPVAELLSRSYSSAAEGIRDFNLRLIEMAQTNTMAALDFARELATAQGPSEAMALWSSHARKQFETMTEQTRELTTLGQKVATSSAEPMTRGFGEALKGTS